MLLQALQEREPRAYQLYLQLPSTLGQGTGGQGTSGAFLGSTPERLYARTGGSLATEAVAGTRPRGPGGDVEQDFWLGLDLLKSSKDHVEFTMVRCRTCLHDWWGASLLLLCEAMSCTALELLKSSKAHVEFTMVGKTNRYIDKLQRVWFTLATAE